MARVILCLALSASWAHAFREEQRNAANPIRKVVTMLQAMQAKVMAEGKKEEALYDKFMCYCKNSGNDLTQSITTANGKIESLTAALGESTQQKLQLEADLKEHGASRDDAKDAMAKATAIREKEAAAFAQEEADSKANLAALAKAISAIDKGITGGFLQTGAAAVLRKFTMEKANLPDDSREELLAFLSSAQGAGYVPKSGEILGILKQMQDEMAQGLADATAAEKEAIASYEALMAAKKKEVATLSAQIEDKMMRVGNLGVENAAMQNDLEDTKESLAGDTKFLSELGAGCDKKKEEWAEVKRLRAEELLALAETIKVLNDDDALELFKKTLPSASASLVQVEVSTDGQRQHALAVIRRARRKSAGRPELDLIALALSGKKIGFEKVIKMVDEMVANLKREQTDDDNKKDYCNKKFDSSDDKKKALEVSLADSETAIEEMEGEKAQLVEEIAELEATIKALDKSVAEATDIRKSERADHQELMTDDTNAKELLLWAKNRLNKFYNPKLYKAPPKRTLTEAETITESFGGEVPTEAPGGIADTGIGAAFVQVSAHGDAAPPPPPETFGPYVKKTDEKQGVAAMIDLLIKDLDKEMAESKVEEEEAQKEYEAMMAEAAKKRAEDAKSVSDKSGAKASLEEALEAEQDKKTSTSKDLAATLEFIKSLHAECDWLVKYYDARKSARSGEIESLIQAKDVLNGADFSLVQTERAGKALRGGGVLAPEP
mmetsp:Transcript_18419/g.43290  ORF Transcript_18419/g.43290 Transcript_18419/m.43290 type:complete len:725 (+) Transcript_18419:56-2230(+)